MSACRAGLSNARRTATRKEAIRRCQTLTRCSHVNAESAKATSMAPVWVKYSRRIRCTRSTTAPPTRGKVIMGRAKLKPSSPSHSGESVNCKMSQPVPTFCIHVPILDTMSPDHSRAKFLWCSAGKRAPLPDTAVSTLLLHYRMSSRVTVPIEPHRRHAITHEQFTRARDQRFPRGRAPAGAGQSCNDLDRVSGKRSAHILDIVAPDAQPERRDVGDGLFDPIIVDRIVD